MSLDEYIIPFIVEIPAKTSSRLVCDVVDVVNGVVGTN